MVIDMGQGRSALNEWEMHANIREEFRGQFVFKQKAESQNYWSCSLLLCETWLTVTWRRLGLEKKPVMQVFESDHDTWTSKADAGNDAALKALRFIAAELPVPQTPTSTTTPRPVTF